MDDIETVLTGGGVSDMIHGLYRYERHRTWREIRRLSIGETRQQAERALAEIPVVSPLDALRLAARLMELLRDGRWLPMMDAREQGATWAEVAEAIGLEGADAAAAAREWYVAQRWTLAHADGVPHKDRARRAARPDAGMS